MGISYGISSLVNDLPVKHSVPPDGGGPFGAATVSGRYLMPLCIVFAQVHKTARDLGIRCHHEKRLSQETYRTLFLFDH